MSANFGGQARLRWILRPGNDLSVVYLHNWRDDVLEDRFMTIERRAALVMAIESP